jgi:hypothetical protein
MGGCRQFPPSPLGLPAVHEQLAVHTVLHPGFRGEREELHNLISSEYIYAQLKKTFSNMEVAFNKNQKFL